MALQEALLHDAATGKPINASTLDHKMPLSTQTPPEFVVDYADAESTETAPDSYNFGAKGFAEPPTSPPVAAINNAIANAIGVHFNTVPITPEMILKALGKA
jgi:xanthine dehydrogenase molybdenum-binding subunit